MDRRLRLLLVLLGVALWPAAGHAQGLPPDLRVQVRDSADQPLAGITVLVRDQAGTHELGRATTDAQGQAALGGLTTTTVRVAVQGNLPSGQPLYQVGDDAPGILLSLPGGTVALDLVSDERGMVIPNPLTMTALESGIPVAPARPSALPAAPAARPWPTPVVAPVVDAAVPGAPAAATWRWWGLLLVLGAVGVGMLLVATRWRAL